MRAALILAATIALACAGPIHERAWIEVTTPNFVITSSMSEEASVDAARGLEQFRALIQRTTTAAKGASPVPTRIFLFGKQVDFLLFAERNVAGFFKQGMRANYATAVKTPGMDTASILHHEYVHFALRNATSIQYPTWYDEGFAEFLSTAIPQDEYIVIGSIPRERIPAFQRLRWIPIERVVSGRTYEDFRSDELAMLYAEAWALVHYLHLGREGTHSVSKEMARYIALVEEGRPNALAFEEAFGAAPSVVGRRLINQLESRKLRAVGIPLGELEIPVEEPRVQRLSQEEAAIHLGSLALALGDGATARPLFEAAVAANPDNARAQAGLGDAHRFQNRYERAAPHFERALALDPEGALTQLDYAEYVHDDALRDENEARRPELLRRARRHYVRSQKLDPSIPETYAMYGSTFLARGEDASRGVETLRHAHRLLASNTDILELLARAYVATDQLDRARKILERVVAWSHRGDAAEEVEKRMLQLLEEHGAPDENGS